MESEKVKEIKKALENCQKNNCLDCPYFIDEKRCRANDLLLDTITLINELENENERLSSRYRNLEINYNDTYEYYREYEVENQQLKDRIAELEKGNAKLLDSVETVQNNRCTTKCELTKKALKQFAEKLNEKMPVHYPTVVRAIDETLKECL